MKVHFRCPHCQATVKASERYVGRSIACPRRAKDFVAAKQPAATAHSSGLSSVPAVGIDLGTTYSVVAYLDPQGRPTCIPNSDGDLLTPSVVLFDDNDVVVGKQAVAAASLEPDRVAEAVKRDMGNVRYRKQINGRWLPPEE
jgi:hypothetical protein